MLVARQVVRDGDLYAGPFLPATLARRTMSLSHKLFGLRSCSEVITGKRVRGRASSTTSSGAWRHASPICARPSATAQAVGDVRFLLEGRNDELAGELEQRMRGGRRRPNGSRKRRTTAMRCGSVQALGARQQKMATAELGDRDVFGVTVGERGAVIQVFQVRRGRVVERVTLFSDAHEVAGGAEAVVAAALQQFYEEQAPPREVYVPAPSRTPTSWRSGCRRGPGAGCASSCRSAATGAGLVDLATRNAELSYRARHEHGGLAEAAALEQLQQALQLPALPRRIECIDISTLQGSETVASLVVCEDGRMAKGEYRKYRVSGPGFRYPSSPSPRPPAPSPGSWTTSRPWSRWSAAATPRWSKPAGRFRTCWSSTAARGSSSAAYAALERVGLSNLVAIGLAKREELVFTRDHDEPLALERTGPALHLLQRIRDEAHRFAVTFHRKSRTKRDFASELDAIAGVGPRRRNTLLRRFGSVAGVRRATREDLVPLVGRRCADAILAHFAGAPAAR